MVKKHRSSQDFYVGTEPILQKTQAPGRTKLPGSIGPERLNMRDLKWRMCALGPGHCKICESSCAYGREWLKRTEEGHGKNG